MATGQLACWKPADLDRIMDTSWFNIERHIAIAITSIVHTPYCSVVYHLSVRPSVWTDGQTSSALWGYAICIAVFSEVRLVDFKLKSSCPPPLGLSQIYPILKNNTSCVK